MVILSDFKLMLTICGFQEIAERLKIHMHLMQFIRYEHQRIIYIPQ